MFEILRAVGVGLLTAVGVFYLLMVLSATRNRWWTSKSEIMRQMNEPRPLPMGVHEFDVWSDRILSGANVPSTDPESLKAILAQMLLNLGPQESHKPDAFFIHSLRKAAANEIAFNIKETIKEKKRPKPEPGPVPIEVQNLNPAG